MYLTQEDLRKIEDWLYKRTVKDTSFPVADPIDGTESIPIIQDKRNKVIGMNDFVKRVADMKLPDFYNVSSNSKRYCLTLKEAISLVPVKQRKLGLTITYNNEFGNWVIYQFKGNSLNQWDSLNYWDSIIKEAIEEYLFFPDEEDITGVRDGNRTFLKFKDRDYNPEDFSGMGRIILRKNLVGTEACSIDDEDHLLNVLKQDMINKENTVYIVQYDFDLEGKTISIPKGCTLWFQGGSINNGNIYLQETAILGAFEFADMGNANLLGKFNTGQIMTFSDDSYKAKEGGYFVAGTKPSSATPKEDSKQDKETFYDKNPNAYTTNKRQELRWWNGEEWILILDITDYQEIKSIINDLIDKHNTEMSACYKYFKTRCYALEVRVDNTESRLDKAEERLDIHDGVLSEHDKKLKEHDTILKEHSDTLEEHDTRITTLEGDVSDIKQDIGDIEGDITSINNNIENIDNSITNINQDINSINIEINKIKTFIENFENDVISIIDQYMESFTGGVQSIEVNGEVYTPDESGKVVLPDYPDIDIDSIKDIVTTPTVIQYITNYMNRKVRTPESWIEIITSKYVYPNGKLNAVTFYPRNNYFISTLKKGVIKDEDTLDEFRVIGNTGEVINLYHIGFDSTRYSSCEKGIICSENEETLNEITLDKFKQINSVNRTLGKLVFKDFHTGQINSDGEETIIEALDLEDVNKVLSTTNLYYREYIYDKTNELFLTTLTSNSISGKRWSNNLFDINRNGIILQGIGKEKIKRTATFSNVTYNKSTRVLSFTVELENLYVIDSSTIVIKHYYTSYKDDYSPLSFVSHSVEYGKAISSGSLSTTFSGFYRSFDKVADNKYNCKILLPPEGSYGMESPKAISIELYLAYSSTNDNNGFYVYSDPLYFFNPTSGVIEVLSSKHIELLK